MIYNYYDLINQGHILGGLIQDFKYPEKICPYCFKPLVPVQAIHWVEDKFQYKALYFCAYPECSVYDEGPKKPTQKFTIHQNKPTLSFVMYKCQFKGGSRKTLLVFTSSVLKL